jgi:ArsR family transcriptional regulator
MSMKALPVLEPNPVVACCTPLDAPSMSDEEAAATAALFKALGDPARVRIVNVLATAGEGVCVCDLTPAVGLSQPTVSHHLRKLAEAGLLRREQRGTWAFYSLDPVAVERLQSLTSFAEVLT